LHLNHFQRSSQVNYNEITTLTNHDIRIFPIYQDGGYYNEYFDENQGKIDAKIAYDKAFELGFPKDTTIYFAVDYDAYNYQVSERIIPYMKEIKRYFDQLKDDPNIVPRYKVGVYGPRNICIRCYNELDISNSFVSNMSTGFSGNLGFPMPKNWSFSQFYETSIGEDSGYLEIDKNDSSGRDNGASHFEQLSPPDPYDRIIKDALSNVGNDIPIFSELAGKIVLDGEERELLDTNLLKVTYSSSKEVTQGDENDTANIIYVIDGQPADNPFYASVLGRIQGVEGVSNEVQVGSKGMVNTLASNIGNGRIKTSISAEFGQIVYTYEVVVTDIELPFTTSVAASIILKVYLKTHNFPPGSPVPVAVTEKVNEVSTEAFRGKEVAKVIVTGVAIVGIALFAIYAAPLTAAALANLASSFTAITAALLGT
jgi:peptidoglycan hydrolase-like protein with peptidoglycan-binding domain